MKNDKEPKSFKAKSDNKKIIVCKKGTASQAIGKIEKYCDVFILTYGQFSLIDALVAILDQTGPAHVAISTWTAANACLDTSADLMASADILSLKMIVDRSFKSRQPAYYDRMVSLFGQECIRAINTHAKFITIRNDRFDIVVRTSMNLNGNPRLENIEISDNKDFADFFGSIISGVFDEVKEGEMCYRELKLDGIIETDHFKDVSAEYIKRSTTNEPRYTHEINARRKCGRTSEGIDA